MKLNAKKLPAIIVFAVSIALIYERELSSFGIVETALPTSFLVSGLWLKDLGLLAPVMLWFLMPGRMDSGTRYIVLAYLLTFLYGGLLFVAYSNNFAEVGEDLRTFLSLFTGLALISNLRMPIHQIVRLLNCLFLVLVMFAFVQLMSVPQASLWLTERVTSYSLYTLTGIPVILLPAVYVLSRIFGTRADRRFSLIIYVCLLIIFIVIAKTRSSVIFVMVSLALSVVATTKLGNVMQKAGSKSSNRVIYGVAFLLVPIVLFSGGETVQVFVERVVAGANIAEDYTTAFRLFEVATVFSATSDTKLLLGSGIGPPYLLISDAYLFNSDAVAQSHNAMHIGGLNVLWRFGAIAFAFWLFGLIRLVWRFVNSANELKNCRPGTKNKIVAMICCVPSIIVYAIAAASSGGYGVISFLCLGMLLGLYRELRKAPHVIMSPGSSRALQPRV